MKKLIIENMKRIIQLLEKDDLEIYPTYTQSGCRSELKFKMRELRRDTILYEKELYNYKKCYEIWEKSKIKKIEEVAK